MNLFIVRTEKYTYATSANFKDEVQLMFEEVYPDYTIVSIEQIDVESLYDMEDNDEIIFF